MAKAREIPGLSTELPYGEVAARVLEVRCEELMGYSENVLDVERIEGVHDMRVATRRLRAAIEVFWPCFPPSPASGCSRRSRLSPTRSASGGTVTSRSPYSTEFAESMPHPDRPGISSLVAELRTEQKVANDGLAASVSPAGLEHLRDELLELAKLAREAARPEGRAE